MHQFLRLTSAQPPEIPNESCCSFPLPESISVERVPDPTCAPDEVIVQVSRCGICGTDVHIYRNEYMSDFPVIPGHEFGGVIVETGKRRH
jgi:threonine dehydrogenase-like Zn-dependent dehydrogenase